MRTTKNRRGIISLAILFLIITTIITTVVYAKGEDKVNVYITTTQSEFQKLYEWYLKDRYDISVDGEMDIRAYIKNQVPVTRIENNRRQNMLLVDNIINFFSEYWAYITGGLGLVFIMIFIRTKVKNRWDEDDYYNGYFYYSLPFLHNRFQEESDMPTINLHQRLGMIQSQPQPNMYYYANNCDEPYVVPKRDYSRYNERDQFNIIKQKIMYYK